MKDKMRLPDKFRQALDHINDFIRASNASLGKAPATWSTRLPFFTKSMVGMLSTTPPESKIQKGLVKAQVD